MKYASSLIILRALHPVVFDQPVKYHFFNNLLKDIGTSVHFRYAIYKAHWGV